MRVVMADEWNHPYSREEAVFPLVNPPIRQILACGQPS
jgi:hypothetical protein